MATISRGDRVQTAIVNAPEVVVGDGKAAEEEGAASSVCKATSIKVNWLEWFMSETRQSL